MLWGGLQLELLGGTDVEAVAECGALVVGVAVLYFACKWGVGLQSKSSQSKSSQSKSSHSTESRCLISLVCQVRPYAGRSSVPGVVGGVLHAV